MNYELNILNSFSWKAM